MLDVSLVETLKNFIINPGAEGYPRPPLGIDWELLRRYQLLNLQNGVHKVGIPDLIILQQVIEENLALLSTDKHFQLMKGYIEFELLTG